MRNGIYIVTLLLLAILIIFGQFNQIPANIDRDEVAFIRLSKSLTDKPYVMHSPLETGHSTLYFYILAGSFRLFGDNLLALRLPAAIFGVINGLLIYLIFSYLFKKDLGFILVLVFITLRWQFNFARFSYEATFLLFLELISLYCLVITIKTRTKLSALLTGVFAGFAFHSYTPGRIFFIIPLIVLFLDKKNRGLIRYYLLGSMALIIPLVLNLLQHPESRIASEFLFGSNNLDLIGKIIAFFENFIKNIGMLFINGDMNGRHNYPGKPALNPILSVMFLIGILFAIKDKKNIFNRIFLIYFVCSLLPTLFTLPSGNPNMLRTYTMIPSVVYFVGITLSVIARTPLRGGRSNLVKLILLMAILSSSLYELRTYFKFQKEVTRYSFEVRKNFDWLKQRNYELKDDWYRY